MKYKKTLAFLAIAPIILCIIFWGIKPSKDEGVMAAKMSGAQEIKLEGKSGSTVILTPANGSWSNPVPIPPGVRIYASSAGKHLCQNGQGKTFREEDDMGDYLVDPRDFTLRFKSLVPGEAVPVNIKWWPY